MRKITCLYEMGWTESVMCMNLWALKDDEVIIFLFYVIFCSLFNAIIDQIFKRNPKVKIVPTFQTGIMFQLSYIHL